MPGDQGLPGVGHFPEFLRYGGRFSRVRYDRYGPVSWMGGPRLRFVMADGPDATEVVLANRDKAFSNEAWSLRGQGVFFRRGLMMLDFEERRYHRKIMQPAFALQRLAGYAKLLSPSARSTVALWPTGRSFRLYYALKQLTLDVATRAFMGEDAGPETRDVNEAFIAAVRGNTAFVTKSLPGTRWRKAEQGRALLEHYFSENIEAKREGDGDDLFGALPRDHGGRRAVHRRGHR